MAIKEITKCIYCNSEKVTVDVWQSPFSTCSREVEKTLGKWGLNNIKNYKCKDCGRNWRD